MDSFNDILIACVKAAGGSKVMGPLLWPEKPTDNAQRALLDALNEERPHKLTPDQALLIIRKAREAGHHAAIEYLCKELGYSAPQPIEPKDEAADLMKQAQALAVSFTATTARLEQVIGRLGGGGK